jgi:hypothetical protein
MPIVLDINSKSGGVQRVKLPVEILKKIPLEI